MRHAHSVTGAVSSTIAQSTVLPSKPLSETQAAKDYPKYLNTACTASSTSHSTNLKYTNPEKDPRKVKEGNDCLSGENKRFTKLELLINDSLSFDLEELRKLAWSGISAKARPKAWKILCGYLPPPGTAAIR